MKISFDWGSSHPRLHLRLLLAEGLGVQVMVDQREALPPSTVGKGTVLTISDRFVARGARERWAIRLFVHDVSNTPLTGLNVTAHYDGVAAGLASAPMVKDETMPANTAKDYDVELAIP